MRKSGKELIAARKKAVKWFSQGKTYRWVMKELGYKSTSGINTLIGKRSGYKKRAVHKS